MTDRQKLYYLVIKYQKGEYDVKTFCDQFTVIYNTEVDYSTLNELEKELFGELSEITARFTPYEEDLKMKKVYYSELDVRNKVKEVLDILLS